MEKSNKYNIRPDYYLNFPQQINIPFEGYKAECKATTRTANATNSAYSVNVIGYEVRKFVVDYMKSLQSHTHARTHAHTRTHTHTHAHTRNCNGTSTFSNSALVR